MQPQAQTRWIRERALALGFDLCGVVVLPPELNALEGAGLFEELARLREWLARGYAGEMKYLHDPRRADPRRVLERARSLIVAALNYNTPPRDTTASSADSSDASPRGWISRYAWGDDYHEVIREKLELLISDLRAEFSEPFEARAYVDTGPILERAAARHAGLGWLAKNTCLINSQLGSWLFLGVIITTLALEPTLAPREAPLADLCGSCTRCLDACPTQAFPQPYILDARRCISYLTIELRGAIPEELRSQMGDAVIGCDICQDVCPWNRKAPLTAIAAFHPRDAFLAPELEMLASLSQEQFTAMFRASAAKRAKWRGLVRNACVALGNSGITPTSAEYPRIACLLESLASSGDTLIAEHAHWALAQISRAAGPARQIGSAVPLGRDETPSKTR